MRAKKRKRSGIVHQRFGNDGKINHQAENKKKSSHEVHDSLIQSNAASLMKGKVFAVSTRIQEQDRSNPSFFSYNQLHDMCTVVGAKVSSQVHKKVHALVASPEAVEQPATQRVRKAWKLGVPVVRIDWLSDCLKSQSFIPIQQANIYPVPPKVVVSKTDGKNIEEHPAKKQKRRPTIPRSESKELTFLSSNHTRQLDLGCCCICHDSVPENVATDCPWCVDCDRNKKAFSAASARKE